MARIDTLVKTRHIPAPSVIKIDVEGGELAAFRGASETIHRHQPHIVFESDENTSRFGYTRRDLFDFLTTLAPYRFFRISPQGDELSTLSPDSDAKQEPADILATVLDDTGVGAVAAHLRHWAPGRRIEIHNATKGI